MVLCTSIYAKSGTTRTGDRLNGFKKGKTQQFNSEGVGKLAYFQKKAEYPFKKRPAAAEQLPLIHQEIDTMDSTEYLIVSDKHVMTFNLS